MFGAHTEFDEKGVKGEIWGERLEKRQKKGVRKTKKAKVANKYDNVPGKIISN